METRTKRRTWMFVYGIMELVRVGSSPLSSIALTWSGVGKEAVLPCQWDSHIKGSSPTPYIQWQTLRDMVFERKGDAKFQADPYQNRVDVPEGVLAKGNCSLHLSDVRFSDAGIYECYLVVGKTGKKRRIFIQSVQLSVLDHKSTKSVEMGGDLTLDLYKRQAETVLFQNSKAAEWRELWQRRGHGEVLSSRLKERNGKLVIRKVSARDEGVYKVMDGQGHSLSTVKVSVKELSRPTMTNMLEKHISLESSVGVNSPSPTFSFLLVMLLYLL